LGSASQFFLAWLGAAGFELGTPSGTLLIDPHLTETSGPGLLFGRLAPDRGALAKVDADLILVSHGHFEHLLDAPAISARTHAPIYASFDACRVARAIDPKSICSPIAANVRYQKDGFDVQAIPCAHGEMLLGVPLGGPSHPRSRYPHAAEMRAGPSFIWVIRTGGRTIVYSGTAGMPHDPLALQKLVPEGADVLLLALEQHEHSPGYARHLIDMLRPRLIIPHHGTLEDLDAFAQQEGARVRVPQRLERIRI
jgi:L-ascorbate metabolism protein UlaG (beta-lactamase superfamily)